MALCSDAVVKAKKTDKKNWELSAFAAQQNQSKQNSKIDKNWRNQSTAYQGTCEKMTTGGFKELQETQDHFIFALLQNVEWWFKSIPSLWISFATHSQS